MRALRGSRPAVQRAFYEAMDADVSCDDVRNSSKQWSKTKLDVYYIGIGFLVEVQLSDTKE
jgi:hypothetical protein